MRVFDKIKQRKSNLVPKVGNLYNTHLKNIKSTWGMKNRIASKVHAKNLNPNWQVLDDSLLASSKYNDADKKTFIYTSRTG